MPASSVGAAQYSLSNLPPDASWDQTLAQLQLQLANQTAAIAGERKRTLGDYGFAETNIDPKTGVGSLTFDPNNPFSKAAVMKQTFDTNRRSTAQSMGAGGQLYSGAFQNAQDLVNRNELQSSNALQSNLASFLARNTGQTKQANTDYELARIQADAERTARFQDNPLYDPATGQLKAPEPDAPPPPVVVGQYFSGTPRTPAKNAPKRIYKPFQPSWRR